MIDNFLKKLFILFAVSVFTAATGFSQNKPIIGVAGISHESNSFNIKKTDLEDFSIPESISLRTPVVISRPNSVSAKKLESFMKYTSNLSATGGLPIQSRSGIFSGFFGFIKRILGL